MVFGRSCKVVFYIPRKLTYLKEQTVAFHLIWLSFYWILGNWKDQLSKLIIQMHYFEPLLEVLKPFQKSMCASDLHIHYLWHLRNTVLQKQIVFSLWHLSVTNSVKCHKITIKCEIGVSFSLWSFMFFFWHNSDEGGVLVLFYNRFFFK